MFRSQAQSFVVALQVNTSAKAVRLPATLLQLRHTPQQPLQMPETKAKAGSQQISLQADGAMSTTHCCYT